LSVELTDTLKEIDGTTIDINNLEAKQTKLTNDLESIGQREKDLQEARDLEEQNFQSKKRRDDNVIQVLEEIIPQLENLAQNGQAFL
jgi:hypothetical protein